MKTAKKKLRALERIKKMFEQLDNNVEVVLASDTKKLQLLLIDLKQADLSKYEKIVLKELS